MLERRQHPGSSRYFRTTPANSLPERGAPEITHSSKTLAISTSQISPLPDRLVGGGKETELRHQFHQGRKSVRSAMNKPMEETWGSGVFLDQNMGTVRPFMLEVYRRNREANSHQKYE
jgi:hypothetical protein